MSAKSTLSDISTLTMRSLKHVLRSPDTMITTVVMPVGIMVLFVFVLGGALQERTGGDAYVNYQVPGILLITVATGISYTAYRLFQDVQGGLFERFRSMPVSRPAMLWAHVLTSVMANLVSVAIVVGAALLFGFRTGAGVGRWFAVVGIVALFTLALTWLAVIPGLTAKTVDGASAFSYPLIFLPLISSAFVPTDSMPSPVRWFAEHQPVTAIVDSLRSLLGDGRVGGEIWASLGWCAGLLVAAYAVAMVTYHRRFRG